MIMLLILFFLIVVVARKTLILFNLQFVLKQVLQTWNIIRETGKLELKHTNFYKSEFKNQKIYKL